MTTKLQKVYRKSDLPAFCGLQRTQISELIRLDQFPAPIAVYEGGRAIVWLEDELVKWQQKMIAERNTTVAIKPAVNARQVSTKRRSRS